MLFVLLALLIPTTADAGRGKGGAIGALIGAGSGAIAGKIAQSQIDKALSRATYDTPAFSITDSSFIIRNEEKDGEVIAELRLGGNKLLGGSQSGIKQLIRTLNEIDVTHLAMWEDLDLTFPLCLDGVCGDTLIAKSAQGKTFAMDVVLNGNRYELVHYDSVEPGFLTKVWRWILSNLVLVGILLFAAIGGIAGAMKGNKKEEDNTPPS